MKESGPSSERSARLLIVARRKSLAERLEIIHQPLEKSIKLATIEREAMTRVVTVETKHNGRDCNSVGSPTPPTRA